jgi:hypothetical protein
VVDQDVERAGLESGLDVAHRRLARVEHGRHRRVLVAEKPHEGDATGRGLAEHIAPVSQHPLRPVDEIGARSQQLLVALGQHRFVEEHSLKLLRPPEHASQMRAGAIDGVRRESAR